MQSASTRSPGRGETLLAVGAMAVLAAVLAFVLAEQGRFSPAVLLAPASPTPPAGSSPAALLARWPGGLSAMGPAELFTPASLSDKIDGKADLYLSAGFLALSCQRVSLSGSTSWIEAFVYDMGGPADAFAVYSSQRRPEGRDAALGDFSYTAGNELCLVHGRYYIELVGSDTGEATLRLASALASSLLESRPVAEHATVAEKALFPPGGLVADSMTIVPADVFGFDRLRNVFLARYRDGGEEVTLFLADRGSEAEAAKAAAELQGFLVAECGGKVTGKSGVAPGSAVVDLGGAFDAVFHRGRFLAGVHQAPSSQGAERWASVLWGRLGGVSP